MAKHAGIEIYKMVCSSIKAILNQQFHCKIKLGILYLAGHCSLLLIVL